MLIVGETYLGADTIALQSGDLINGVVGVPGEIHNEGQLVHALRGRLGHVRLKIARAGIHRTVTGHFNPAGRVTERQGVYVSGVLFAPAGFRDSQELNLTQPLVAHSVQRGSLAQSLEIEKWDVLVKLDGQPVRGLGDLYARVQAAREADKPVTLVLKRWSSEYDQLYDYVERTVAIEDLEFVGPVPNENVARR